MWEITELIQLCTTLTQLYLLIYLVSSTISRNKVAIIEKKNCILLLIEKNIMNQFWIKYQLFVSINESCEVTHNCHLHSHVTHNCHLHSHVTHEFFLLAKFHFII